MMKMCNFPKCKGKAIGGFKETQNVSGLTTTGTITISETYWCDIHESSLKPIFSGKAGEWVSFRPDR